MAGARSVVIEWGGPRARASQLIRGVLRMQLVVGDRTDTESRAGRREGRVGGPFVRAKVPSEPSINPSSSEQFRFQRLRSSVPFSQRRSDLAQQRSVRGVQEERPVAEPSGQFSRAGAADAALPNAAWRILHRRGQPEWGCVRVISWRPGPDRPRCVHRRTSG